MGAAGDLEAQVAQVKDAIRKAPSDGTHRAALFQLYCVLGNWSRALTQLEIVEQLLPEQFMYAQVYRKALACEAARREVFAGTKLPLIFGQPSEWIGTLVQSLRFAVAGEWGAAQSSQAAAFAAAPVTSGEIDGTPFEWLADADSRLGPVLEAFVEGEYQWIPLDQIKKVTFQPPADVIDAVFSAVTFTWPNEGRATGFIPVRYPASEGIAQDAIRLARLTEWTERAPGFYEGTGQRTLTTDGADFGVLDVREINFNCLAAPTAA